MSAPRMQIERRVRPVVGLSACGDAVVEAAAPGWHLVAIVDALGHGPEAELSARAAEQAILGVAGRPLVMVFEAVHRSLFKLRGVVMSGLLAQGATVTFAGVGNVEVFAPPGVSRPVPMAGTLGSGPYRFRDFPLPFRPGQRWVLASDGIKPRHAAALLSEWHGQPAPRVADALLEQAARDTDDVSLAIIDVEPGR